MNLEHRYRRLLRWYPRGWRAAKGELLLGTLMDAAEHEGRTSPRPGEAWTMRLTGLGERLDARAAIWFSALGMVAALAGMVLLFTGTPGRAIVAILGAASTPLITLAVCAILRQAHLLSQVSAVAVGIVGSLAWLLSFCAALSWSIGFDQADAGIPLSPFAAAFVWLFLAAWLVGGAAVFLLVAGLGGNLPRWVQATVGILGALVLPPTLGVSASNPLMPAVIALFVLVIAAFRSVPATLRPLEPLERGAASVPLRRAVAVCAALTTLGTLAAIAFALAGHNWVSGIDGTRAMQLGIAAGLVALIPLVLALGAAEGIRIRQRRWMIWGATLLFAASMLTTAVRSFAGLGNDGSPNGIPSAICGVAMALLVFALLRFGPPLRTTIAVASGALATAIGWLVLLLLPWLGPIAGIAFAIWGLRRTRAPFVAPLDHLATR